MSAELISSAAGILLSLLFGYWPGLAARYAKQESQVKALIMLGALLAVSAGAFGLSCAGWFDVPISCDKAGVEGLVLAFILAAIANQTTYKLAVRPFEQKPKSAKVE
jgi:hypothetical protein